MPTAELLADFLRSPKCKLKRLEIDGMNISVEGDRENVILRALQHNATLEDLNLHGYLICVDEIRREDSFGEEDREDMARGSGSPSSGRALSVISQKSMIQTVHLKMLEGHQVGSAAGSGARRDLSYYEPVESYDGYLLLGHGFHADNLVAARGPMVKKATKWRIIWSIKPQLDPDDTDDGHVSTYNGKDFRAYLPECEDDEFIPLGVFCVFGTDGHLPPKVEAGLVHKSCCIHAVMGSILWSSRLCNSEHALTLHSVEWSNTGMNLMFPSVASKCAHVPTAHALKSFLIDEAHDEDFAATLTQNDDAMMAVHRCVRKRQTLARSWFPSSTRT
jgi:hypothetical protein